LYLLRKIGLHPKMRVFSDKTMSIVVPREGRILRYAYDKSVQFSKKTGC
jgi:hypothetical protein